MAKEYKYDQNKVYDLLDSYLNLIKDEVSYKMYVTGGVSCPYVWIEIILKGTIETVLEEDLLCFFIDGETNTGKFFFQEQFGDYKITWFEGRKTKKAIKEFMLKIINFKEKKL